ncbi:tumor protein p53-inducible nuclear protein 2 isoform X3 [Trachemys scripta elegans]|uniref:tumor protein p53-inducible nuclear protein 2 isoform X3 n=1 Tax=Trachemys scripta elegans TaxID=31138 RepID=UPI001554A46A|nr:tumor protein p53-inducible nuclear protein 2 isoform X3 [Trachemys scripta elegans]
MFQRLTSLFFSDSSTPEGLEEPKPFVSEEEEEDGWLIIDLPEGPGPVRLESSPMEDLLIEHPSMSVYVTSNSIVVERESSDEPISEGDVPEPRLERRTPHHPTSLTAKAAILEKVSQVRRIQRAKQLVEKHKLSQKVMQRQNRARERHPRRAKHQGSFVYQPCQRQYNY